MAMSVPSLHSRSWFMACSSAGGGGGESSAGGGGGEPSAGGGGGESSAGGGGGGGTTAAARTATMLARGRVGMRGIVWAGASSNQKHPWPPLLPAFIIAARTGVDCMGRGRRRMGRGPVPSLPSNAAVMRHANPGVAEHHFTWPRCPSTTP